MGISLLANFMWKHVSVDANQAINNPDRFKKILKDVVEFDFEKNRPLEG